MMWSLDPDVSVVKRKRGGKGRFGMPIHTPKKSPARLYLSKKKTAAKFFSKRKAKNGIWLFISRFTQRIDTESLSFTSLFHKPISLKLHFTLPHTTGKILRKKRLVRSKAGKKLSLWRLLSGKTKEIADQVRKDAGLAAKVLFFPIKYLAGHPKLALSTACITLIFSSTFYVYVLKGIPNPSTLSEGRTPQTTLILDRNGRLLYRLYKDTNRIKLSWDEIPDVVKKSTIAIEDSGFYHHPGISIKAIVRAFRNNLGKEQIMQYQGASTITQQLVKNTLLTPEKSYQRKLREIILALWTETLYSKQAILNMYLNEVGYGGPAYGIEASAQTFFGKEARDLTLAQAAFLAGLPAAPTTFSPFGSNPNLAFIRQNQVLERMYKLKMISKEEFENAKSEQLAFAPQKTDIEAPHFVMLVKEQLINKLGEDMVTKGGLEVVTTLDLDIQHKAEDIISKQISELKDRYNIHNAATLVTAPTTGEILAMVGSADYFDTENKGYVNTTNVLRQPGSSIKVVNYGYAFDHGYTPTSVIEDGPVVYKAPGVSEVYAPVNYDGKYHGNVTLRSALANSYNIPAVKLLNRIGVDNMLAEGKAMGIRSWENAPQIGLSLTLGALEVSMLDMARAYGTIANLGTGKELRIVREIHDSNGKNLAGLLSDDEKSISLVGKVHALDNKQVLSSLAAWWLIDILSDEKARLPAFGTYAKLSVPNHKVAVKTGTSNNFRDNWTIGFSPDYLVATWVGNNDGSFMNKNLVSGITGAAPIWNETMTALLADKPPKDFPKPSGLIPVKICAVNGLLTCPNCPQEKTEYFTVDKIPTKTCYFRSGAECDEAKKQTEGKSDEEKKALMAGCAVQ